MRFNPDSKRYRVEDDKAVKSLLSDLHRLSEAASAEKTKVEALRAASKKARERASAAEALAILGDKSRAEADKADATAAKAEADLSKAVRRLTGINDARTELERRISKARAEAQARVDRNILADFQKIAQETVDLTEKAAEAHEELAAFDDLAKNLSSLPVFRLRNYLPGYMGGITKNGYKMSLSPTEEWICQVRGRGLAKSSMLEKRFGGIVTKRIEQHGGGKS